MTGLINWSRIRSSRSLIESLNSFLEKVFGTEVREEAQRHYAWGRASPESYEYLRPPGVHRAAKWYAMLQRFKERGYSFDLRFSAEIEEFQKLLAFAYSFDVLIQSNVISLKNSRVKGALLDRDRFESLIYETLIAANYVSNGFDVQLPDLLGEGRVDIHIKKDNVEAYIECKKLRKSERYVDIAIKTMQRIHRRKFSGVIDVTLKKTPTTSKDVENVVKLVERAIEENKDSMLSEYAIVRIQRLPPLLENVYELHIPQPESVEYLISSFYAGIFNGILKIKEPKLLILRDPNRIEKLKRQLLNELRRALEQLRTVTESGTRKIIYMDISEVAGRPVLQLPEFVRVSVGPEIITSHLEAACREWLLKHPHVDTIVLTQLKLYLDTSGLPYVLVLENKPVLSYVAPGWSIETLIIPVPHNAPPEALVNLGVEMVKRGNYRLAELYYRMAINAKPNLKEAWNNLGCLYTNFLGRPDVGLKHLERALELDANHLPALINRAIALAKLGKYDEAFKELDRALKLDPNNPKAWYNKAFLAYCLGRFDEARGYCSKALELDPSYTPAKNLMKSLEETLKRKRQTK